ncbi:Succinate dehydrogenase subunit D [Ehrlichia minasensis]|nr:Succinate dehydrogenase subunit D [Ehrlichia minasensis]
MASHSVYHWLIQRATAFVLLPLSIWFLFKFVAVVSLIFKSLPDLHLCFTSIGITDFIILLCFFVFAFYHGVLGIQVILEDYIHSAVLRASLFLVIKGIAVLTVLFLVFIVLYNKLFVY